MRLSLPGPAANALRWEITLTFSRRKRKKEKKKREKEKRLGHHSGVEGWARFIISPVENRVREEVLNLFNAPEEQITHFSKY